MSKSFRTVFIVLMILCTGILLWHAPASEIIDREIETAREDLIDEQDKLEGLLDQARVKKWDNILEYQERLDELLSPDLDELQRYDQTIKSRKAEKGVLQSQVTAMKKTVKKMLSIMTQNKLRFWVNSGVQA